MNWQRVLLLCVMVSGFVTGCASHQIERSREIVRVEAGLLRGVATNGVVSFLGVPYAAPPVGALRWAPPQRPESWRGVRDATKAALPPAQGNGKSNSTNEDCLYLNITAPIAPNSSPRPVMVWIHGGGFSGGKASSYDPRRMTTEGDVIVVTVEFRLNIFGCFGFPGLKDSGTFILLDQQAALSWIRRNIGAFGGDPENVTLFGESGGAIAACAHLTSPSAKGLFHKVILQSGAATTSWPSNSPNLGPNVSFWRPMRDVESAGAELAVAMGCPEPKGSAAALKWLRHQPVSALLAHSGEFYTAAYGGRVLPENPASAFVAGRFNPVPAISGFTRHEGRALALGMLLTAGGKPMSEKQYHDLLLKSFGERAQEVEAEYPLAGHATPDLAWADIYTDRMFAYPQLAASRALTRKAPTFVYEFADTNAPGLLPFYPGFPPGASHSGELPLLFDIEKNPIDMKGRHVPLSEEQRALGVTMIQYWTRFAHSGNPNGSGAPQWPRFSSETGMPQAQVLAPGSDGIVTVSDLEIRHRSAFWKTFGK